MLVVEMALGFGIAYEDVTSGGIFGQESHITKSVEILSCRQEFVSKRSYPTRDRGPSNRVPSQLELYPLQPCSFDSPTCTVYVLLNSPLHIKSSLAPPLPLWNMN
jgi:hypothetical protein